MGKPDVKEYEIQLKEDSSLSLRETSEYFERRGTLQKTLVDLASRLEDAGVDYAVVGALAMREHGFVRATVDIDLLMRPEGLERFQKEFVGHGFRPAFSGANTSFRSTDTGVRIDILTTGDFPGDGKPKRVSFPEPASASILRDGIRYLKLEILVELKLASGISAPHRLRDLADVQDLIREANLPLELTASLDESVRDTYRDLWQKAQTIDPLQGK
ncbi:nucleotidyltransferase family protein [bacterium]|nr:nucleotidyltransferase family protein [bacterium]